MTIKTTNKDTSTTFTDKGAKSERELFHDKHAYSVETYPSASATGVGINSDRDEKYERLHAINESHLSPGFNSLLNEFDKKRVMQSLCNSLGLCKQNQDLCVRYIVNLDLDKFGNQKRLEKVALAIIKYVVEKTQAERIKNDPYAELSDWEPLSKDQKYQEIINRLELDRGNVMRVSQQFKKWVKNGGEPAPKSNTYLHEVGRRNDKILSTATSLGTVDWTRAMNAEREGVSQ